MIVGNSYSDLQNTALQYDRLNQDIQQRALENQLRARALQSQDQQQSFENQNQVAGLQDSANRFYQKNLQDQSDQAKAAANAQYQFGATQAARSGEEATKHSEFEQGLELSKEQIKAQADAKKAAEDYQTAQNMVLEGSYDETPEKIATDFENLNPMQLRALNSLRDQNIRERQAKITAAESAAAGMNQVKGPKTAQEIAAAQKLGIGLEPDATGTNFNWRSQLPPVRTNAPTQLAPPPAAAAPVIAPPSAPPVVAPARPALPTTVNPQSAANAPVPVNSQQDYDALPVGTVYIDSTGVPKVKKPRVARPNVVAPPPTPVASNAPIVAPPPYAAWGSGVSTQPNYAVQ